MLEVVIFLTSGLFLGWSLGANDAANVWGTAVGTRMIRFKVAALTCSLFVIAGAVISGAGASHTLGRLGTIGSIAGAFTVALAAALSVYWMTKAALPVSTSQAIVGAIVGWTIFAGRGVDTQALLKIAGTWVFSPILTAVFAVILYFFVAFVVRRLKIHLLLFDGWTRFLLLAAGAFGSYSLGANNIANVMGVFIESTSDIFQDISIGGFATLSGIQQLFLIGGISIAVGVFTYSKRVMLTVGSDIYKLQPITAFIVVLSSAIVMFLFASQGLKDFLVSNNLPSFPLVPVSSSQSIVGGVIGVGLARGGKNLNFKVIGRIGFGWLSTPVIAGATSYVSLFIVQNVFAQPVF
ncbi:MAG: inorganic phosphate transporter [Spirochaetota bacterium]